MSGGMVKFSVPQEIHYLAQLVCDEQVEVKCRMFKHLIRSNVIAATPQLPNVTPTDVMELFTVPKDTSWLVTYAAIRSDGDPVSFTTANQELRSDEDLSPNHSGAIVPINTQQLAQWIVNGSPKTQLASRVALINAPCLLVFNPGETVQLRVAAGITVGQVVTLHSRINGYLVPAKIGGLFSTFETIYQIEAFDD